MQERKKGAMLRRKKGGKGMKGSGEEVKRDEVERVRETLNNGIEGQKRGKEISFFVFFITSHFSFSYPSPFLSPSSHY